MTVDDLNSLSDEEASELFRSCCGSTRWVNEMVARRPFASVQSVMQTSDEAWSATGRDDWREAFSHHPRIGERSAATVQSSRAADWSSREQANVASSPEHVQEMLARANEKYEERFGHIYIVCATGKTVDQMLAIAQERLSNDPETELRLAAEEQRRITSVRLGRLFGDDS